jgi:hypothetical protein
MRSYCQYCEQIVETDILDDIEYCSKCGHEIVSYDLIKYKKGGKHANSRRKRKNNKSRFEEDSES